MARIVIAGSSENARTQLNRLLVSSGFGVFRVCASGGELRRALNMCEDGVVILIEGVPDCLPDDLLDDFGDGFHFLLIARPEILDACESPRIFKMTSPCSGDAVVGAVGMLSQLNAQRLPKRSFDEKTLVERAKTLLMNTYHITEPEAHRRMQRYAMAHGIKMTDYAVYLLQGSTDDARQTISSLPSGNGT